MVSVNNERTDHWFVFTQVAGTVTLCACVHMLLCEGGVYCASPAVYHGGFENCRQLASSFIFSLNSGCSRGLCLSPFFTVSTHVHVRSSTAVQGNRLFPT